MDAEQIVEKLDKSVREEPPTEAVEKSVSEERFEELVAAALEGVGGTMLFKLRIDADDDAEHVAAASVGDGKTRHFLILSLPVDGGQLRVEQADNSKSPVARIAASYAGLADVLATAA